MLMNKIEINITKTFNKILLIKFNKFNNNEKKNTSFILIKSYNCFLESLLNTVYFCSCIVKVA